MQIQCVVIKTTLFCKTCDKSCLIIKFSVISCLDVISLYREFISLNLRKLTVLFFKHRENNRLEMIISLCNHDNCCDCSVTMVTVN